MDRGDFLVSLTAGGLAGVSVDLILFPLDTVKTRLQSPQGFKKAGGFRGIYAGVPSTAVGSFPNAAAFFVTYEYTKAMFRTGASPYLSPITHMLAASLGEIVACLIRVPSEVVKQRAQVSPSASTLRILSNTVCEEGILGLYRGYKSTVLRENYTDRYSMKEAKKMTNFTAQIYPSGQKAWTFDTQFYIMLWPGVCVCMPDLKLHHNAAHFFKKCCQ
ncbi:mitochondrial S-adenosylmethionine carrier protein isoform X6 [Rhineura floridana]|uniref:mitochondrial S-adenosylmethionine carrier protein isoform X6 n=1 Tax=Rhineura floridana TaxID=261503 RepID=UPI002AC8619E|nr:mitochondrial S-adenosylmethionine carrier protein isoform X6 [Rhineura floridana]